MRRDYVDLAKTHIKTDRDPKKHSCLFAFPTTSAPVYFLTTWCITQLLPLHHRERVQLRGDDRGSLKKRSSCQATLGYIGHINRMMPTV